ncbi:MAG: hypothetical protein AAFO99_13495, partial [Bacteroidota bacterium]
LPVDDPEATISFLGITIGSNGFADVSTYIWFLSVKIIPFLLLIIWFFTSRDWWYHILLIPIAMYAFQLFEGLFDGDDYVDTENILWLLPICMVVIPFVYFVRVKLYDKHVHGIDLEAMDAELKALREKEALGKEKMEVTEENIDTVDSIEEDLSANTSNKALDQMVKQFRHAMRSLLNL